MRGATGVSANKIGKLAKFQSTRPMRGATSTILSTARLMSFNPRAPCGARPSTGRALSPQSTFQSTRPMRGATHDNQPDPTHHRRFNPRAPCGARREIRAALSNFLRFNPRPPAGARLPPHGFPQVAHKFQSTRPMRGATSKPSEFWKPRPCFNPRAPCGARRDYRGELNLIVEFQSTRPMRGATGNSVLGIL